MIRTRLPSGVPGLDVVLKGGFFQSGVYIIQGRPGAGKTILANQICFAHAARGGAAAYVTLLTESIPRMFQNLSTLDFFDERRTPEQIYYVSGFDELESGGLQGLLRLLRGEIRNRRPSVLVLDGMVSAAEKASDGIEFRKFIHELQAYASVFPCTISLLGTTSTESAVQVEHTMVEGLIELANHSLAFQAERTLHVRKFRGGSFIDGRHVFTITDHGAEVFPRLESLVSDAPVSLDTRQPLSTGIAGLDRLSGVGGLRSSSSTLLSGASGSGKTSLGTHFLSASNRDEPGLLFSFDEPTSETLASADAWGLGLSRLVSDGVLQALWRSRAENILDELGQRLLRMVQAHHARRVFVDGLHGFIASAAHAQRLDRFVAALVLELRRLGATSVFSIEARDAAGRLPPEVYGMPTIFDNIITLRSVEVGSRIKRQLSITKMRGCPHDDSLHEYRFGGTGLEVDLSVEDPAAPDSGPAASPTGSSRDRA